MPIASTSTATIVPKALTRPGLMVVDPSSAPTNAGSRNSGPTALWPTRKRAANTTPAKPAIDPLSAKTPMTRRRAGMPVNSAALRLPPMA
jgi:hypothetical protein